MRLKNILKVVAISSLAAAGVASAQDTDKNETAPASPRMPTSELNSPECDSIEGGGLACTFQDSCGSKQNYCPPITEPKSLGKSSRSMRPMS